MSAEWMSGKLGNFIELKRGYDLPQAKRLPGLVPLVSSSGVSDQHKVAMVKGPGVVTGRYGTIGQVFYVEEDFWPLNTTLYVRDFKGNDPKFVHYFLKTVDFFAYSDKGAVPGVNRNHLHEALATIPPLDLQKEVAATLGALDDRITLLRETNATLEAIAQALFKSWFVDFDPVRAKMEGRAPEGMDEATAALFTDGLEESESELGAVPRGWQVSKFEDFINRMSVGKKFDKKTASEIGTTPILDQGKSGIIGFHNESPGIHASLENPVIVFANHTCYMRLISFDFSVIQNVLPFTGKNVDTVWAFYATKGRVKFSEYKGHWPDFSIEKTVVPAASLTFAFRKIIEPLMRSVRCNELQAQTLSTLRDTLLPRLISGQLRLPTDMPSSQNPSYQSEPP